MLICSHPMIDLSEDNWITLKIPAVNQKQNSYFFDLDEVSIIGISIKLRQFHNQVKVPCSSFKYTLLLSKLLEESHETLCRKSCLLLIYYWHRGRLVKGRTSL